MRATIGLTLVASALASPAFAKVVLHQVPALCGSSAEVLEVLAYKMPNPEALGTGGDSSGAEVATLFVGNGYWALIAMVSPERVCVVASGHNWTPSEPRVSRSF